MPDSCFSPGSRQGQDGSPVGIIGAGPGGLSAAYLLGKKGRRAVVFEADSVVGGISRTVKWKGFYLDIGGHRFFTKIPEVEAFWHEILGPEDFMVRPRKSRIYYKEKFLNYPIDVSNVVRTLGLRESILMGLSYIWGRLDPRVNEDTYEGWLVRRFGRRLYRAFFESYTEKVWGVPPSQIGADWAAQRIKELTFTKAITHKLMKVLGKAPPTSLIERFYYPRYGPGMMWEVTAKRAEEMGVQIYLESPVVAIERDKEGARRLVVAGKAEGEWEVSHVISTMPLAELVKATKPAPPDEVLRAASGLRYRDFLTVGLVVPWEKCFDDNWIYIHYPEVKVGRIQNFGAWSPFMIRDGKTLIGLEYFVFQGDEMWSASDEYLVELATKEVERIGLFNASDVEGGFVVRMPKAYPMYDPWYRDNVRVIREWLAENMPNVFPIGRNGMHRYNNQDHSIYTAMLAVENVLGASHDIWAVNVAAEYLEEGSAPEEAAGGRAAPIVPR